MSRIELFEKANIVFWDMWGESHMILCTGYCTKNKSYIPYTSLFQKNGYNELQYSLVNFIMGLYNAHNGSDLSREDAMQRTILYGLFFDILTSNGKQKNIACIDMHDELYLELKDILDRLQEMYYGSHRLFQISRKDYRQFAKGGFDIVIVDESKGSEREQIGAASYLASEKGSSLFLAKTSIVYGDCLDMFSLNSKKYMIDESKGVIRVLGKDFHKNLLQPLDVMECFERIKEEIRDSLGIPDEENALHRITQKINFEVKKAGQTEEYEWMQELLSLKEAVQYYMLNRIDEDAEVYEKNLKDILGG